MAKTIVIHYKGNEYTLEFTRRTVERLERDGLVLSEASKYPMTVLPQLFEGAFLAHHRKIQPELVDEIFEHITKKDELLSKLAEMYQEPINSLFDEPDEDAEGNADWGANW